MKSITFIDTEISEHNNRILDYGAVSLAGMKIHSSNPGTFMSFIANAQFLCGHNVIHHDLKYLKAQKHYLDKTDIFGRAGIIDTLYLSALLFPQKPYHNLVKDDKLQTDELNNPLNDSLKAKDLFFEELDAFRDLPYGLKRIYYALLAETIEFRGFFEYMDYSADVLNVEVEIRELLSDKFCANAPLAMLIVEHPIELAYCLSLIHVDDEYSITPRWLLYSYPELSNIMHILRGKICLEGCSYCDNFLDPIAGLKRFFGYPSYRLFDGVALQEKAVTAAVNNKSLLAVFPTGGGKSITFQIPALMAGRATKGLTIVISPLQSLMKDQVDNLERAGITDAVTINGLLDPIERAEALRRVESGEAMILYISPESLRSRTIERLLLGRRIERFVIDEAHCFSAWGQDFRVDYLYIAEFIKNICTKKNLDMMIPVSCFTATAKQNVINDIQSYFRDNLGLELELYTASSSRKNLQYKVMEKDTKEKYEAIRNLLAYKQCPTIIYVARTRLATELSKRLCSDGYVARAYHGKMDKKEKSENQDAFIRGEVDIMVATSAFGMGVDKSDVGMVIHFDISDSLENYVQEAGRAGRDQSISAECFVLFNDEDLNGHFNLLNQTKISIQEIQQVWKAIKDATKTRSNMSNSALEIARNAGWDEGVLDVETRVKTAVSALEDAGYIKRGQNMPRVFADSIRAKNVMEARIAIERSGLFNKEETELAVIIIQKMIASRTRSQDSAEAAESRVDYIADDLGIGRRKVIHLIQLLRDAKVLSDAKDLVAYMEESGSVTRSRNVLNMYRRLEEFLLSVIPEEQNIVHIKELNEQAAEADLKRITPDKIRTVMNHWVVKGYMTREVSKHSQNHLRVSFLKAKSDLVAAFEKRWDLSEFILQYLDNLNVEKLSTVEFSVLDLMEAYNHENMLFGKKVGSKDVEDALFYLSRISALKLEGGFLVTYNALSIERLEKDNKIRYKVDDYKNLERYYQQKTQMIHIVGEYARKMIENYTEALQFVEDYFQMQYTSFLRKYFRGDKGEEIRRNLTPTKFRQLFGELSPTQLKIIKDKESQQIVVAAGPGSGKTRILVHKLASLLMMEDVKTEQLLMITFSRAAVTEFKKRLIGLIGPQANYVEIKTFHSYCFDLLGRVGNIEKSSNIIQEATGYIERGDVEHSRITKTVLVIDEAQDMDVHEYRLIRALMEKNDDMRVIAVGDDDQNIYTFRGSDSKYMKALLPEGEDGFYELVENYRSKDNLVSFTNVYVEQLANRLKSTPIMPVQRENGMIHIIRYKYSNIMKLMVDKMLVEGIKGSTCILTATNEEALQVTGLLQKQGIDAKLIQSNERYDMINLDEIRYFVTMLNLHEETYTIEERVWDEAKRLLCNRYARSENLAMCKQLLSDFEAINKKRKFRTDFLIYLSESREEDFLNSSQGAVSVSTIHKSKGREFDHVVMLLKRFNGESEEGKRQLYVGMTRAKESLSVHCDKDYFDMKSDSRYSQIPDMGQGYNVINAEGIGFFLLQLSYKDVFLDYYKNTQRKIANLISGDKLLVDGEGCSDVDGSRVLRFSKKFKEDIRCYGTKGYRPVSAKVNHVIFWKGEGNDDEIQVLFPVIEFRKD